MVDEKIIYDKLDAYCIEKSVLKPQTIKQLCEIQEVIEEIIEIRKECIETYKKNRLSIHSIVSKANISRQTIYNNIVLKMYIEKSIEEDKNTDIYETVTTLKKQLREKDEIISKMVNRDAEIAIYKKENQELKEEILSLRETVKSQELVNIQLLQNLNF